MLAVYHENLSVCAQKIGMTLDEKHCLGESIATIPKRKYHA